ncbi:hypothetical protein PAXINDRAFT_17306 [Paxillus involutus ATCC 200175]|uniref:RecQ mediated genome instability protein 1 OB-fold domain-containing protein n=1 Tax=Paxillus involutus ATCC 200175 TaxID=664439 RepID=A0A0C9T1M9_PAXIN|nr:hypothetical protein PAXINDRAFT_17306 [Paxillus involutus ATCC 200175]
MTGPAPLVEIRSITDITRSAFGLSNTHHTRLDHADLGLAQPDGNHNGEQQQQDEEDGVPVPRFLRGVLRFELSNGCTTFSDIEFRFLVKLELGITPLGYKFTWKPSDTIESLRPLDLIVDLRIRRTQCSVRFIREHVYAFFIRSTLPTPTLPIPSSPLDAIAEEDQDGHPRYEIALEMNITIEMRN